MENLRSDAGIYIKKNIHTYIHIYVYVYACAWIDTQRLVLNFHESALPGSAEAIGWSFNPWIWPFIGPGTSHDVDVYMCLCIYICTRVNGR